MKLVWIITFGLASLLASRSRRRRQHLIALQLKNRASCLLSTCRPRARLRSRRAPMTGATSAPPMSRKREIAKELRQPSRHLTRKNFGITMPRLSLSNADCGGRC